MTTTTTTTGTAHLSEAALADLEAVVQRLRDGALTEEQRAASWGEQQRDTLFRLNLTSYLGERAPMLLGEIRRLQDELAAARRRIQELEGTPAVGDVQTGVQTDP